MAKIIIRIHKKSFLQNLKKLIYSTLTFTILFNLNIPANATQKEVKVYSGRHYNTDRSVFKKFSEETGIKVRQEFFAPDIGIAPDNFFPPSIKIFSFN